MKNFENFRLNKTFQRLNEEWMVMYRPQFIEILRNIDDDITSNGTFISTELIKLYENEVDNGDIDINYIDAVDKDGAATFKSDKKLDTEFLRKHGEKPSKDEEYYRSNNHHLVNPVEIKIGKLIQKLLTLTDKNYTNQDVEKFVNKYIAYQKKSRGVKWEILKGDNFSKGYHSSNYLNMGKDSILHDSCMSDKDFRNGGNDIFGIYEANDNCSLLTLLNDEDKIMGRALLWEEVMETNGYQHKMMDRIYTIKDSDVELFRSWARESGYIYRNNQNNYDANSKTSFGMLDKSVKELQLFMKLKYVEFENFPYMDTFRYLNRFTNLISNVPEIIKDRNLTYIELNHTDGRYDGDDSMAFEDVDDDGF